MPEKTIGTYTTKGFSNSGVKGGDSADRLTENGANGITTQVMKENNAGSIKQISKDTVVAKATGNGVDGDKPVDTGKGGKSAGNVGASNVNHA